MHYINQLNSFDSLCLCLCLCLSTHTHIIHVTEINRPKTMRNAPFIINLYTGKLINDIPKKETQKERKEDRSDDHPSGMRIWFKRWSRRRRRRRRRRNKAGEGGVIGRRQEVATDFLSRRRSRIGSRGGIGIGIISSSSSSRKRRRRRSGKGFSLEAEESEK